MNELTLARHNELVDPVLAVWSWPIPVYLFLGGWVAGMMVVIGYFLLRGRHREDSCVCGVLPALSVALLSLGMLALFLDLEHKRYVWRLYTTFRITSVMSWGAWILLLVYPALLAVIALHPPRPLARLLPALEQLSWRLDGPRLVWFVAMANVTLGVALGIYTGVLLSAMVARPFWNSAILGPLFLASGLSSAAAFTHLVARRSDERVLLAKADNVFLLIELFLVGLFLIGLLGSSDGHARAARLVLGGPFTASFWILVVGLGLVVPLILQALAVTRRIRHTPIAPLLVLAGGLALRFVFVLAGQASRWPGV